ncbi:MAG: phosphoenolpyruvate--protein phosphotransferase [Planctomycetaceae bacterium]|nr:phosphoenolpyruvate--protein phosphotransferase [Planctomycetaceae bacterium]MBN8599738.1 phosphoenolpyruvate--protein phosphotransferase [Planctomycetota bacterium]
MRRGIAVSPGVTVGTAYCIHEVFVKPNAEKLVGPAIVHELARFENARRRSIDDVRLLQQKVQKQVGKDAAAIFAVHETILQDAALVGKVRHWIQHEGISAQEALSRLLDFYKRVLSGTGDEYLQERIDDLRDVIMRLSSYLSEALQQDSGALDGPIIVVADELLPSQVVMLGTRSVNGIVTQAGSQTSHAAIIARSRGIPAVSGVSGILRQTKTGDTIVVDGREGHVIINPDSETEAAYRKLEREFVDLRDQLAHNRDLPCRTADGIELEILANINGVGDCRNATAMGACGVGLYRTEYLYLTHPSVPDEEEQVENYRAVLKAAPNHQLTIRTLDIGGDKTVPFLGRNHREANPFMGWRSIRLSFEHPEFFSTQIRAILRAAAPSRAMPKARVQLLFPMVTNLEELRRLHALVNRNKQALRQQKKPYGEVAFGMMVEVPAAAVMMDQLIGAVDFVSIGSNDLVQYLMAADRDNPKVSHLCQPLAPPVLRVLSNVIGICSKANRSVTLCGEMAGQPLAFMLLLGMGLRRFSMSPHFVPSIKELAAHITIEQSEAILKKCLKQTTTKKIKSLLKDQLLKVAPQLEPLLTEQ